MKIVFRVDSSSQIGIGHLMRCLTLANEQNDKNNEIFFVCRDLPGNFSSFIKYPVFLLPNSNSFRSNVLYLNWLGATQKEDSEQTISVIPKNIDLLIIDSYSLDHNWHKKLRPFTKKIMVIDDLGDGIYDCDILLNQNLSAKASDYKDKAPYGCQLLLGCDFALLRPEFQSLRREALIKRKHTKVIKNILISMGGADISNKTFEVLKEIPSYLDVVVVLSSQSQYNNSIIDFARNKSNIKVIIDADNMAKLMFDADLAIGAGGSTSWERCCMGLPTLLYVSAENQNSNAENLQQLGAVKIVDNLKINLETILNNLNIWKSMSERAKNVCDGAGVKRIDI